jgi:methyl-accepting chemotaxis protein
MEDIVRSVQQVADLIKEISAATQEQSHGIGRGQPGRDPS